MEELRIAFMDVKALLKRLKFNQIRLIKKHIWSNSCAFVQTSRLCTKIRSLQEVRDIVFV